MGGPLKGLRIIEMAGLGPTPFCGMMFSDMGADVIRIDAKGRGGPVAFSEARFDVTARGRRSIALDLKKPEGRDVLLQLVESADGLIEGFRPGVMERLGLGPDTLLAHNRRLVFGRMTGWGQFGPLAQRAGHDINYIAISGALHAIGAGHGKPVVPLNLVGDFGGGAMFLAFGVICALLEASRSGQGQVVDAAMCDGSALLSSLIYGFKANGMWSNKRSANLLDGAAHFYDTYACADGKYVAVGALEPQFFNQFCEAIGLAVPPPATHFDAAAWPGLKQQIADILATGTRDEWCERLEHLDACFAPVLDWDEATQHPHNKARGVHTTVEGVTQPAPAPRFSRTPGAIQAPPPAGIGAHSEELLLETGFSQGEIDAMRAAEVI